MVIGGDAAGGGGAQLMREARRIRQADERPDGAAGPRDLQRRDPIQYRLLRDNADGGGERGDQAENHSHDRRFAGRGRESDHDDTRKRERAAEQQIRRGSLFQEHRRERDDEDGSDQHEHRRGTGVDPSLGLVQHNLIGAKPEQTSEDEER